MGRSFRSCIKLMKAIRNRPAGWAILGGLIALVSFLPAQIVTTSVQPVTDSQPMDSVVQIAADALGLLPVAPEQISQYTTFWVIGADGVSLAPVPWPCLPPQCDSASTPIFLLGGNGVLVDATGGFLPRSSARGALRGVSATALVAG